MVVAVSAVGLAMSACGGGGGEAEQRAASNSHQELPPQVREMIRNVMVNNVNRSYMSIWTLTNRGNLEPIPQIAEQLKTTTEGIAMGMQRSESTPQDLLDRYEVMAMQCDSIAKAAAAGDLSQTIALTRRLKKQTCDGCHAEYQITTAR